MRSFLAAALLAPLAATAGVNEAIDDHILPGVTRFADATAELSQVAAEDCRIDAVRPAWNAALDAWLGVAHLQLGPVEREGRALAIAFWPDTRGMGPRALRALIEDEDPIVETPEGFREVSVAGRGLFALEWLLYDDGFAYTDNSYTCALVQAATADLAGMAGEIAAEWREDFAADLRQAGEAGNGRYLSEREAKQALYTALVSGIEFVDDQRLGRPLGSFDRPRPTRAESRRAGRSLRNVILSLEALRDFARSLADVEIPRTELAFDDALEVADGLDDPVFAGIEDPGERLKVEILQQRVELVRDAVAGEIGAALGVSAGFNSADGD